MNATKQCKDRFEDLVALVMGELDSAASRELQEHITLCDTCRQARDALVEEEKEVRAGFEALARSLGPIGQAVLEKLELPSQVRVDLSDDHFLERMKKMMLAHKRLLAASAATVAALAASLILYVSVFSSPTAAYALEQTAQANRQVTSYHAKITPAAEWGEVWVQLHTDGTPLRARWDLQSRDDGAKVVVVSKGNAEIWFKDKKSHVFIPEKDGLKLVMKERKLFDPKLAFEELQAQQRAGKVQVETKEASGLYEPIMLTVTSWKTPDQREVYAVNPKTKLVKWRTTDRRRSDQWERVSLVEYLDYNQEIDAKVFQFDLPKDVTTIDQVNRKPGLVKGNLSEEEMATRVAREFFEALMAEDYAKAGLIFEGIPARKMKELFGNFKVYRIVEIGKPVAGRHPDKTALKVPVKVELEMKRRKVTREFLPKLPLTDGTSAIDAVAKVL